MPAHATPLDVSRANQTLLGVYENAWDELLRLRQLDRKVSTPHLVRIPKGYEELSVRVAIVGQQTANSEPWGDERSASELFDRYPEDGVVGSRRGSPFWRAARQVTDALAGQDDAPVLWANLVAVDVGGRRPPAAVRDAARRAVPPHGLLRHVLAAAQPDAVVFFVGPTGYYGWELGQQYPDLQTEPVDGYPARTLHRLVHPELECVAFRTYHPAYLQRSTQWDIVDALPVLVRAALRTA